ncbi:MAG: YjbH domain-containing protein [Chlamydiota bacterium]
MKRPFILLFFLAANLFSDSEEISLFHDLEVVESINKKIQDQLPFLYNYTLQGGYFTMPSARMKKGGNVGGAFSFVPPYRIWSVNFQYFNHLELSGNYWIYSGIQEGNFGHLGYGDDADRAGNIRLSLLNKGDGLDYLPEIAIGMNDFFGSRRFHSSYIVGTYQFLGANLETTLGIAHGRMRGLFGALSWSPFRNLPTLIKNVSFVAEYDSNDYAHHKKEHPDGKSKKFPINAGIHFSYLDIFHVAVSSLRGKKVATTVSLNYNLGESKGLFTKYNDPPIYTVPINSDPIGIFRSEKEFTHEIAYAFREQGLDLYYATIQITSDKKKHLWLKVINVKYRKECDVRQRIEAILSSLLPEDIDIVSVVMEADGILTQEYRFKKENLEKFSERKIGPSELKILSPLREASSLPSSYDAFPLYKRTKKASVFTFTPRFLSYFGNAKGKFKYDLGFVTGPQGYLFDYFYYDLSVCYIVTSSSGNISDADRANPSRLFLVRTDAIKYYQTNSFHVETAYVQKSWNIGNGWFFRLSGGYYEIAYTGITGELLYYPVNSVWAVGCEVTPLLKRNYTGLGFQYKVRKLEGSAYKRFPFHGLQYFLDFYYDIQSLNVNLKVTLGQFLAKDKGARFEIFRYFPSGFRFSLWYTITNARDVVNNKRYYDKGFSISMPLDFFLPKSSRTRLGYAMSEWLRDMGAKANTGKPLYPTLYNERQNH